MVDRDRGRDAGAAQDARRLIGQMPQLGLGPVGHERAAHDRHLLLRQQVGDQMRLRAVDDDRPQAELLCDAQRGEDVVRAVRVEMRLRLAPEQGQQRFELAVVVRIVLIRVILRPRLARKILLGLVQLLADERRGRHAGDRRLVLIVIDRLGVLAQRELDRQRRFEDHIVHPPAGRLDQRDLPADRVGAARADRRRRHARLARLAEAAVHRVDAVDRAQLRRDRVGVLVAVRALEAQPVLIQAEVGVDVDQAGGEHAALPVQHVRAGGRLALAHAGDPAVLQQHPAGKAGVRLVHGPHLHVLDQCLFHAKPLENRCLTDLVIYGILNMAVERLPCTVHIFIPTILLFALFQLKGRVFLCFTAKRIVPAPPCPHKNKTEVALGFCVQRRRREPFLRSAAWRTSA